MSKQPPTQAVAAVRSIDAISQEAAATFANAQSFEQELTVARCIRELRAALTNDVMADVMCLMNTSLGFRTDRDPTQVDRSTGKPYVPYAVDVVRDVFIEARLRGFHTCNNEFNIIAGRFYGALTGFERLVRQHPKVTDFADTFSVPVLHGDKGAIVRVRADWKQAGVKQSLEREFAVRVNVGMGADAIIGKAKRKLYAAVYSRLIGIVTPEGEAGDDLSDLKIAVGTTETGTGMATFSKEKKGGGDHVQQTAQAAAGQVTTQTVAVEPVGGAKPPDTWTPAQPESPQTRLARFLSECGVKFDDFRDFLQTKGLVRDATTLGSYEDVPTAVCERLQAAPKTMAECVKKFGSVQKQ